MARDDLLQLSETDLADIANRGNVNRAKRDLAQGKVTCELRDEGGTVTVVWSDGPTTVLPAGKVVADSHCTCAALGTCRHIVRAVLAYQEAARNETASPDAPEPWSPGDISDETLARSLPATTVDRAHKQFSDGLVVELVRSTKPTARFHSLKHTVRFMVPGDVRYAQCDCEEPAPCVHAALAVWAFRELEPEAVADLIVTGSAAAPADTSRFDEVERALQDVAAAGFAHVPAASMDRLRSTEVKLRKQGSVWPAEILGALRQQYDHYHAHDARFSPDALARLVGELMIRFDALRHPSLAVPRLFIEGDPSDTDARLGQTRLIGLGCNVELRHRSALVQAMMQDESTGAVVAVGHLFGDSEEGGQESFSRLAAKLIVKGRDLESIGAGQLIVTSATLHSDHRLSLGRATSTVYAQRFQWEELRPPVLAESFQDIRARLAKLPPASLRPRRLGENLHVVRIDAVESANFSSREQAVRATLRDASGATAELFHPYMTRNREGTERLLNWLTGKPDQCLFVAGSFRLSAAGLLVEPTGLVFTDGEGRVLVQPWVDDMDAHLESSTIAIEAAEDSTPALDGLRHEVATRAGEALIAGTTAAPLAPWAELRSFAEKLQLRSLEAAIGRWIRAIREDPSAAPAALLELVVVAKLSEELG